MTRSFSFTHFVIDMRAQWDASENSASSRLHNSYSYIDNSTFVFQPVRDSRRVDESVVVARQNSSINNPSVSRS